MNAGNHHKAIQAPRSQYQRERKQVQHLLEEDRFQCAEEQRKDGYARFGAREIVDLLWKVFSRAYHKTPILNVYSLCHWSTMIYHFLFYWRLVNMSGAPLTGALAPRSVLDTYRHGDVLSGSYRDEILSKID